MSTIDLVNKYVHKHLDPGFLEKFPNHRYVNQQGRIKSIVSRDAFGTPTAYEVQWYECGYGTPAQSEIILTEQMLFERWSFYDDHELWVFTMDESLRLLQLNNDMIWKEDRK